MASMTRTYGLKGLTFEDDGGKSVTLKVRQETGPFGQETTLQVSLNNKDLESLLNIVREIIVNKQKN